MKLSRRAFLQRSMATAGVLACAGCAADSASDATTVLVNHVGFTSSGSKIGLLPGEKVEPFAVIDTGSGRAVHHGETTVRGGDFGMHRVADFSPLQQSGSYQLQIGGVRSASLTIDLEIYSPAIRQCVGYFAIQRCGDGRTGYRSPCHLDDGCRTDDGKHRDVTGGWHDACDVRKWVDATIYGMLGLSRVLESWGNSRPERGKIIEELRWGNAYFHKMQAPDGFLMNYCGGDDGNNFTDNEPGTKDDRRLHVEPADVPAQFHFVTAQAAMIRALGKEDPAYARQCEEAAQRCLRWTLERRTPTAATSVAAGIIAACRLFQAVPQDRLTDIASGFARKLLSLQEIKKADGGGEVDGYFRARPDRQEPSREIEHGNLPLLSICELLSTFPKHPDAGDWRTALRGHGEYLKTLASLSAFGTIPFGLYLDQDPGGNRQIGSRWYRWFMKPKGETGDGDWWVGINSHLASNGVGLSKAGRLLQDADLTQLAQRQLDWIVGANPLNASTITRVGRNQPPLYVNDELRPPTPTIPGGVMNGLGGSADDEIILKPGSYHTCEYWTPMVAYTMELMTELQSDRR